MMSNRIKKSVVLLLALLELQVPVSAVTPAPQLHTLRGHVIPQIQKATRLGRVAADERVDLSLVVQIDLDLMNQTLDSIYGRQAKNPGHFLSSTEFAQRFGLADKRKHLSDFAQANGLSVNPTDNSDTSMVVKVSGRADAVEKAFNVQLNRYQGADGKTFRAHETDPMVPETVAADLNAVLGLSNPTGVVHPHLKMGRRLSQPGNTAASASVTPQTFTGTGLAGTVAPADIKTVYGITQASQDGSGQSVALLELDGYNPADISGYAATFGLSAPSVTFIGVDGMTNLCGLNQNLPCNLSTLSTGGSGGGEDEGMFEVALDIEMVMAVAPNAAHIYVYDSLNSFPNIIDQYDRIATDNLAPVVSTSWGSAELLFSSAFATAEAPIFQRMAVQGQGVFAASGDNGAFDDKSQPSTPAVDDPASQPYVTGVGGTTLSGTPSAATETAWSGSGGGVSAITAIPSYQSGISGAASQTHRNVPDVSLNADDVNSAYYVEVGGAAFPVGGTSAATPLWAALMALVNQSRVALGNSPIGFANPSLYQILTAGSSSTFYRDITSGNNGGFFAGTGYDNVTGVGSYKGSALISFLSSATSFTTLDNLSDVYAYPNPWDTRKTSVHQITIANVPGGAKVQIFTVSGFLVKTVPVTVDHATWDMTNDSGRIVASGLYIFLVTNNDKKMVGKLAIIK